MFSKKILQFYHVKWIHQCNELHDMQLIIILLTNFKKNIQILRMVFMELIAPPKNQKNITPMTRKNINKVNKLIYTCQKFN